MDSTEMVGRPCRPPGLLTDDRRMLIAEDLLLLLTDDDTGKLAAPSAQADVALGGALLIELTLTERVDIAGPEERVREGRPVVRDPSPTGDSLLDEALATVGHKEGKKPQSVVAALGKRTRVRLYERLAEGGLLRAEEGRVLGIFPSHRWPSGDAGHEAVVRAGLVTALRRGTTTDARTWCARLPAARAKRGAQGRGAGFCRALQAGDERERQADRRGGLGGEGRPAGNRQHECGHHRGHLVSCGPGRKQRFMTSQPLAT